MSGADEGSEFPFESGEARLGRTADNDIVVKDGSASRSHARVFEKGGRTFVEDLGSSNGTKVNGAAVKAKTPKEIKPGDHIEIGDWALELALPEGEDAAPAAGPSDTGAGEEEGGDPDETSNFTSKQLADKKALARKPPPARPARRPAPEPEPDEEPQEEEPAAEPPPRRSSAGLARAGGGGLARGRGAAAPEEDDGLALSAADKARQRRELQKSTGGKLQLAWMDMSKPVRVIVSLVLGVMFLGSLGSAAWFVMPHEAPKRPEPTTLTPNGNAISDSFGEGDGVTYRRTDLKSFSFEMASPTKVVGVLHYMARNISKDEVLISLNGSELGSVPPDTMDVENRDLDLVLPAQAIKLKEENTLVFDNVKNPPEKDAWMIWNIWVEIIPVPEMSAEDATRRAKEELEKGSKFYDLRTVGAENLFRSWKTYREAWLLLEATPNRDAEVLNIARTRMREIRPELDRKCSQMRVEFKKVMNTRPFDEYKARTVLTEIPNYFPTKEHPCFNFAQAMMQELNDISEREYAGPAGGTRR